MDFDELLAMPWNQIPQANHQQALTLAQNAGRTAARIALTAQGGGEMASVAAGLNEYNFYVIQSDAFDDIETAWSEYWESANDDQRLAPFAAGWLEIMGQESQG